MALSPGRARPCSAMGQEIRLTLQVDLTEESMSGLTRPLALVEPFTSVVKGETPSLADLERAHASNVECRA